jgi:hypothetical protein
MHCMNATHIDCAHMHIHADCSYIHSAVPCAHTYQAHAFMCVCVIIHTQEQI